MSKLVTVRAQEPLSLGPQGSMTRTVTSFGFMLILNGYGLLLYYPTFGIMNGERLVMRNEKLLYGFAVLIDYIPRFSMERRMNPFL